MNGYDEDSLTDDIRERVDNGTLKKALVFVSSKEKGKSMQKVLAAAGISCSFLFTESSDGHRLTDADKEEEQTLINEETFRSQVLLTTTRLENGVNIVDPELTHIYPYGFEEIALKQQIGRYRRRDDRKITVVFRVPDEEAVNRRLNWLIHERETLQRYEKASDKEKVMMLIENDFVLKTVRQYSFQRRDGQRKVSGSSCRALSYYIRELRNSLETLQEGSRNGLLLRWLGWFGLQYDPTTDESVIAVDKALTDLISLLDGKKNCDMDKADFDAFRQDFKEKHHAAFPEAKTGRSDRIPGVHVINQLLDQFGCEIVSTAKGVHRLQDKEGTTDVSSDMEAV